MLERRSRCKKVVGGECVERHGLRRVRTAFKKGPGKFLLVGGRGTKKEGGGESLSNRENTLKNHRGKKK